MKSNIAFILFIAVVSLVGQTNSTIESSVDPLLDPVKAHIVDREKVIKDLREQIKQLQYYYQMQSITPKSIIPEHIHARILSDDSWYLTTDTNHNFMMKSGTNVIIGDRVLLEHK